MDTIQRTKAILAEAETALASLASEAAKGAHYGAATCLIDSAREVHSLAVRVVQKLDSAAHESAVTDAGPDTGRRNRAAAVAARLASRAKSQRSSYPKFVRQGEELVKIGWSRSEKSEYEHKCPKKVLALLAAAITRVGANGRRFPIDRVLPIADPADGRRIPDYQVYLCVAWFRELGLLVQHGRQGYSLTTKAPVGTLIEARWADVPRR
jgi:hypothetical protein